MSAWSFVMNEVSATNRIGAAKSTSSTASSVCSATHTTTRDGVRGRLRRVAFCDVDFCVRPPRAAVDRAVPVIRWPPLA